MHPDTNPVALPPGWAPGLTPDQTAALLRHVHDLAHHDRSEHQAPDLRI
jgi:hypothetical protein